MIYLTDKAYQKFHEIRRIQNRPQAALRVAVLGGNCAGLNYHVGLDEFRAADDLVIESRGTRIYLDWLSAPYLWGSEVEWMEVEDDAGFVIFNPNQGRSRGGCGKDGQRCMTKGDGKTCLKSESNCSSGGCGTCGSSKVQLIKLV